MKRALIVVAVAVLALSSLSAAQYVAVSGNCELPGQAVVVSGLPQSGTEPLTGTPFTTGSGVMASYPQCLVTVYPANSGTPVPTGNVYSSTTGAALGNPFTANTDGSWVFFAVAGCYDILLSSGTSPPSQLPATKTLSGKCSGGSGTGSVTAITCAGTGLSCSPNPIVSTGTITGTAPTPSGGFGIDANTFTGADPCLKLQAAIYSSQAVAAGGGVINGLNIPVTSGTPWTCSVNPFSTPSQSSPIDFAGLPTSGIVYLPNVALAGDLPFIVPNKWRVQGVGGYGPAPSKTTFQPSNNFLANRVQTSAPGGGSSGCSSIGGQTVTITGTSLPAAVNLIGMMVLCSSNASATAVPTPQNAQIVGMITAATSGVLTLSGVGSSGTFTNTGWTIVPLIAGWGPTQSFGSGLDEVTVSCQAPSLTYVTGCVGWLNVSGNESSELTNFAVLGADYMGMALFSAQSQNGGEFRNVTINSSAHGTNSTIAVELGGTGFNAGGGGGSGLCAPGNPCVGTPNRGFFGFTIIGSGNGTGTGGIGFDVNSQNITIAGESHCESLGTCALVGNSAVARNVTIDGLAGCTASGCAVTSVVDISAAYASGAVPAPTQAITLRHILPGFTTTWAVRDFINLVGSTDPVLDLYDLGDVGNGSTPPMSFTNSTLMSNITSGGVLSNVGSASAAGTVIPIISQLGGVYYAHGFNNNGVTDLCAQYNNAMKWVYAVRGVTSSVIIDGTGFNRPSPFACATDPFAGAGVSIPASGVLRLGLSALSLSTTWHVPAGWIVQGYGGAGLGSGGATGSLLVPNVNGNTVNANFANDTVSGTVSATAGSVTITGAGSNFTSVNQKHLFLACATLPCTTQTAMVQGVVVTTPSTTSLTLDVPAQANLSGAAYTITPPLIDNSGIIRDVGIDGFSFGTGSTNGNGGFFGVYQEPVSSSYLENVSFAHVNALPIDVAGANVGELNRIQITSSGLAVSTFTCIAAPSGVNIRNLNCATGTTAPTLSYGVYASGQSFTITNALFQDVNIGVELAVSNTVPTNAVTLTGIASGGGSTAATTLIDLAGVNLGTNTLRFAATLQSLACGGCTSTVVDHISTYTLTDGSLQSYILGQSSAGCRNLFTDSQTSGVPNVVSCASGAHLILANVTVASSCQLASNNGEWNCSGTVSWGTTLGSSTYQIGCMLSQPKPTGSYAIPAGYDAKIYFGAQTTTGFTYYLNDDHSGSNGAIYTLYCEAFM